MEIKLNDKHSIEHKDGYWIYHIHSVSEKGNEYKSKTQTYAKMLDMHHFAKEDGFCGEAIMNAVQTLIDESQKEAGRYIIKQREIKAKGKLNENSN